MSNKWFWGLLVLFVVGGLSAGILYRRYRILQEQPLAQDTRSAKVDSEDQKYLDKLNGLQRKVYGFVSQPEDPSLEVTEGYLIFISTGEVEKKEIVANDTGEIAEVYTITGISKDVQGIPVEVEVVTQAVLRNEGINVYFYPLERFVNDRGLSLAFDERTLLSVERLKQVFSSGTTILADFWISPLNLKSPYLDSEGSWVKLHNLAEKTDKIDINSLAEFVRSGLTHEYKKIIIPSSYAFLDNP